MAQRTFSIKNLKVKPLKAPHFLLPFITLKYGTRTGRVAMGIKKTPLQEFTERVWEKEDNQG